MLNNKDQLKIINEYLEEAYCGAELMNDSDNMLRISRAIAALNADIYKDIFMKDIIE